MRFQQLKNKFTELWFIYYDVLSLGVITLLSLAMPFFMFDIPKEGLSERELIIKGVLCSLNGFTLGLMFAKYIYQKHLDIYKAQQAEREMQMLLRFRETVSEITKNHQLSLSEVYGHQCGHSGSKHAAGSSDKRPN